MKEISSQIYRRAVDIADDLSHNWGVKKASPRDVKMMVKGISEGAELAIQIIEARLSLYNDIGQINALKECVSSIKGAIE